MDRQSEPLTELPTIQILKHPVLSSLASYIDAMCSKGGSQEEYDPIVPLQLTGDEMPILIINPGVSEVLILAPQL